MVPVLDSDALRRQEVATERAATRGVGYPAGEAAKGDSAVGAQQRRAIRGLRHVDESAQHAPPDKTRAKWAVTNPFTKTWADPG
jgi:hypothetical protein